MSERKKFAWIVGIFLIAYFVPFGHPQVSRAVLEGFNLLQWYALRHTLGCLVPALFIAGAISTQLRQSSILGYLGPKAPKATAFAVASVAGVILAVCSCSVLPMFAGIYQMGAGLGPATTFLYSGPAINIMAIFLSGKVLGIKLGLARVVAAVSFSIIIGLVMGLIFAASEKKRVGTVVMPDFSEPERHRPIWKTALYFLALILFLVFSDWYNTNDVTLHFRSGAVVQASIRYDTRETLDYQEYGPDGRLMPEVKRVAKSELVSIIPRPGFVQSVNEIKWYLASFFAVVVLVMLWRWFSLAEVRRWLRATWDYALMIVPLLFLGVFVTGFVGALLPENLVASLVGGNSFLSSFIASFVGTIWYFATLTEIPIVDMLMRLGMGEGPALALLLAGPALSLPSILVINRVMGPQKTFAFCMLTIFMSTVVGYLFGQVVG